jgi:hypothetical protein
MIIQLQILVSLSKDIWTDAEDEILVKAREILGSKWRDIVKTYLPGRSENSAKNRWHSISRKRKRQNDLELEIVTRLGTAADADIIKNLVNNAVHMTTPTPQSSACGDSSLTSWMQPTQANRQLAENIANKFEEEELVTIAEFRNLLKSHIQSKRPNPDSTQNKKSEDVTHETTQNSKNKPWLAMVDKVALSFSPQDVNKATKNSPMLLWKQLLKEVVSEVQVMQVLEGNVESFTKKGKSSDSKTDVDHARQYVLTKLGGFRPPQFSNNTNTRAYNPPKLYDTEGTSFNQSNRTTAQITCTMPPPPPNPPASSITINQPSQIFNSNYNMAIKPFGMTMAYPYGTIAFDRQMATVFQHQHQHHFKQSYA